MNNNLSIKVYLLLIISFLLFSASPEKIFAGANQDAFEDRKQDWIENGTDPFAKAVRGENVDQDVKDYMDVAGNRSMRHANPVTMRILLQYPNSLSAAYRDELIEYYNNRYFGQLWGNDNMWIGVSPNQMMNELAPMYIFCELYPDGIIHYNLPQDYRGVMPASFSYGGRTYANGNYYNGLQFSRDLIYWVYENKYLNYDIWADGNDWT